MRTTKTIHVVSCHAEGEVGDVIVGGVAPPPGETLWEQSRWIARDGTPDEARDIAETGIRITKAANEQLGFTHPENTDWDHISFCQIAAPIEMRDGIATGRNAVAIRPAKIDRSPTGTGCSARLAVLHALGRLKVGDRFTGISLIGSEFYCTIAAETTVADRPAIIPTLAGRAWITGTHQHMLDPTDPWPGGHRLSDTWPRVG